MTKKDALKKLTKENAAVGGVSLSYILVLIAQYQGIPITEAEAVLFTGLLTGLGAKIKEIFGD